jgi:hypothetical protein
VIDLRPKLCAKVTGVIYVQIYSVGGRRARVYHHERFQKTFFPIPSVVSCLLMKCLF